MFVNMKFVNLWKFVNTIEIPNSASDMGRILAAVSNSTDRTWNLSSHGRFSVRYFLNGG